MSPWLLLLLFLAGQATVSILTILLAEGFVEERTASIVEWTSALGLAAGFYLLASGESSAEGAMGLALGFGVLQFLCSAALGRTMDARFGLGEDLDGLGPYYPLAPLVLVVALFVPLHLGALLDAQRLFAGRATAWFVAVGLGVVLLPLKVLVRDWFGDEKAMWGFAALGGVLLVAGYGVHALSGRAGAGLLLVETTLLAVFLFALAAVLDFLGDHLFDLGTFEEGTLRAHARILGAQAGASLVVFVARLLG